MVDLNISNIESRINSKRRMLKVRNKLSDNELSSKFMTSEINILQSNDNKYDNISLILNTPSLNSSRCRDKKISLNKIKSRYLNAENELLEENEEYFKFLDEVHEKSNQINDEDMISEQLCTKRSLQEFICCLTTLLAILSGVIYNQLKDYTISSDKIELIALQIKISLLTISLANILFIISTIYRYLLEMWIQKANNFLLHSDNLYTQGALKKLLIEIFLSLANPNYYFHNKFYFWLPSLYTQNNSESPFYPSVSITIWIRYQLNDFLIPILYIRLYIFMRYFLINTKYNDMRSVRVGKLLGTPVNRLFAIRCILASSPYIFIALVIFLTVAFFTLTIRAIEGQFYLQTKKSYTLKIGDIDYGILQNSLWSVIVTMTTVGYGDYVPRTWAGRFLMVSASFTGTIIISFMVIALQNFVKLSFYEESAFEELAKNELCREITVTSGNFFRTTHHYIKSKKAYYEALKSDDKVRIQETYDKAMKSLYKRLNFQKKFRFLMNKFRNLYDPFREAESLKQRIAIISSRISNDVTISIDNKLVLKEINELSIKVKNAFKSCAINYEIDISSILD